MSSPDNNNNVDRRVSGMDKRVDTLDSHVRELMQNQTLIQSTLNSVCHSLEKVSDRVNQPIRPNYWGIVSAIIAIIVVLASGVNMRVAPLDIAIAAHAAQLAEHEDMLSENNALAAALLSGVDALKLNDERVIKLLETQQTQIGILREKVAAGLKK